MTTLGRTRLRLATDLAVFDAPLDILRRTTPQFWRGNDLQFELALFFNGTLLSVSNLASLTLEVRPLGANGGPPDPSFTPLMGATISSFDDTTTLEDWHSGAKQQAVVAFTAAQSNIAAGAAWLSIFAITKDTPGRVITLCAGPVRVLEDGAGLATTPLPAADTFYTSTQSDARFALLGAGGEGGAPAGDSNPLANGTAAPGTAMAYSRADHVHPTDTARAAAIHANQHTSGGSDPVTVAQSQVTGLTAALAALAPLASPTFTGTPTAPTISLATDVSTKIATTAFVQAAITAAGGGGTWGSIGGTLSSQADLTGALAAKAPLASPAFTGTPTAPTPGGSDNSTKVATTAWVRGYTFPVSNDGSGHYYIGGSGPITLESGNPALLSISGGGLAVYNPTGSTLLQGRKDTGVDVVGTVLTIQRTGTGTGGSADIGFATGANPQSGLVANANYGCIFLANEGNGYPSDDGIGISGQPGWLLSDPTSPPTSGIGRVGLYQEWADNGELSGAGIYSGAHTYYIRPVFAARHDFSVFIGDPYYQAIGGDNGGRTVELPAPSNNGYAQWIVRGTQGYRYSSSTKASAGFVAYNEDGDAFTANMVSSNAGVSGMYKNRAANLISSGSGGMSIYTTDAGASLRLGSGAGVLALTIDAAQNFVAANVTTSAPNATLANSQYQFTVYDNAGTAVFRVRYKDAGGTVKIGDLALA